MARALRGFSARRWANSIRMVSGKTFFLIGALVATTLALLAPLGILTAESPGHPATYPYCLRYVSDTSYHAVQCPNAPSPTETPAATNTPVIPATLTPTPPVSATPTIEPTPTPEITPLPTSTITTTPSPQKTCKLRPLFNINIREPAGGTRIGVWTQGVESEFDEFLLQSVYLYGHHTAGGWSVVAQHPPLNWWVSGTPDAQFCFDVEGWPGWVPPAPIAKTDLVVGFFSMPNGNVMEQVELVVVGAQLGIVTATHVYANASTCLQVMGAGGVCSFRHGSPDCPANIFQGDPRQSARDFMRHDSAYAEGVFQYERYKGLIWIDPINECNWGDTVEELAWWGSWFNEYITEAAARNWPPLQLPSLGPGYGNELMFKVWAGELQLLYDNGGLFAMHVYNPDDTWLCPFDEWLADRMLHNYEIIDRLGIDVRMSLTEVGQGWGNTPPNIPDMACWMERVASDYPFVKQAYIWEYGPNPTWILANWEGYGKPFLLALDATLWN